MGLTEKNNVGTKGKSGRIRHALNLKRVLNGLIGCLKKGVTKKRQEKADFSLNGDAIVLLLFNHLLTLTHL